MIKRAHKLKIRDVSEDELAKQNKKHRYLMQYADIMGEKPGDAESYKYFTENSVYNPEKMDDFFLMQEAENLRETEKSRKISLKNNITLRFQGINLALVFVVMVTGYIILGFHHLSEDYIGHDVQNMRTAGLTRADLKSLDNVAFDQQVYDYKNSVIYRTIETLHNNLNAAGNVSEEKIKELTSKFNMLYIDQHAEGMPNGCEIVSLAMVISRDYRDITVQEISENYLEKKTLIYSGGLRFGDDPTYYYIGDPEKSQGGFGILAPGLTDTANKILHSRRIPRAAQDISGCSDEELFEYVSQSPVIIWYTLNLHPVRWGAATWHLPETNRAYSYPLNQHCAVLVDYTDTTVTVYDPTFGILEYERDLFLRRWSEIGPFKDVTRQAVIIH